MIHSFGQRKSKRGENDNANHVGTCFSWWVAYLFIFDLNVYEPTTHLAASLAWCICLSCIIDGQPSLTIRLQRCLIMINDNEINRKKWSFCMASTFIPQQVRICTIRHRPTQDLNKCLYRNYILLSWLFRCCCFINTRLRLFQRSSMLHLTAAAWDSYTFKT